MKTQLNTPIKNKLIALRLTTKEHKEINKHINKSQFIRKAINYYICNVAER